MTVSVVTDLFGSKAARRARGRPKGTTKRVMEARKLGFEIERGIPLPPRRFTKKEEDVVYPFASLEPNESFLVPYPGVYSVDTREKLRNHIYTSLFRFKNETKWSTYQISTRSLEDGIRVWRVK